MVQTDYTQEPGVSCILDIKCVYEAPGMGEGQQARNKWTVQDIYYTSPSQHCHILPANADYSYLI